MSFKVKIDVFEGPFDLLLQLILKQELVIYEVPIADITSEFMEHVGASKKIDLDSATEFLLIASTLLLIKARSLISSTGIEDQIEEETEEAKDFLVNSLVKYKTFANAAQWLEDTFSENGWYHPSLRELEEDYSDHYPDPFEGICIDDIADAIIEMLIRNVAIEVDTSYIAKVRISVDEHRTRIIDALRTRGTVTFSFLVESCRSKIDIIGTFLALLELNKKGEISLRQTKPFSEIKIKKLEAEKSGAG